MINYNSLPRNILFLLFLGSYVLAPLTLLHDFLAPFFTYILLAGVVFLTLYFATYCISYFSIKRSNRKHGYT